VLLPSAACGLCLGSSTQPDAAQLHFQLQGAAERREVLSS